MAYNFTEEQTAKILEEWGQGLFDEAQKKFETYAEKWDLSNFDFAGERFIAVRGTL